MSKEALLEKLEALKQHTVNIEDDHSFNRAIRKAKEVVRQHTDWQPESVSVLKIAKMGIDRPWKKLPEDVRRVKLTNARDAIAAMGFAPLHDDWQPIETAPKDGTYVLLHSGGAIYVGWCDGTEWETGHSYHEVTSPSPTHWLPLPEPPKPE